MLTSMGVLDPHFLKCVNLVTYSIIDISIHLRCMCLYCNQELRNNWKISASADGGPRSWVWARLTIQLSPSTPAEIFDACVWEKGQTNLIHFLIPSNLIFL